LTWTDPSARVFCRNSEVLRAWTKALVRIADEDDKPVAYLGWLRVVGTNLALAAEITAPMCRSMLHFRGGDAVAVDASFSSLLKQIRTAFPDEFARRFSSMPLEIQKAVSFRFALE